jgi:hypothetical protein
MLKVLSVTNFMAIEKLELEFTASLTILAGQNEAGKSSVRDAILWLWTGQARGLRTHGDQAALIKEGAKFTEVSALLADGRGFTRRKTQKTAATVMGDIPDIGLSPAILFDPYTFLSWPEDQRQELLFKVIPGLHPTEQNVYDRLIRWPAVEAIESVVRGLATVRSIAKMAASHGFPGAEKECVSKRREAKRVRDTYKDATEPEKTITIDGKEFDIPTLNVQAIEATLKDLQKEKDDLLRQKGAGEARAKRLETIREQLEKIGTLPLPPAEDFIRQLRQDLQDGQNAMTIIMEEIKQSTVAEQFFPATCPAITLMEMACPKAGIRVGHTPQKPGVIDSLKQNQHGLNKTLDEISDKLSEAKRQTDEYQALMARKTALEEELARLQSEPEAGGTDLDTEIATRQRRIDRGQAFRIAIANFNTLQVQYLDTLTKLAAAEQEVIIYDALQKALAPDGIPSQMIAEALDGINELLEEAATYFFPGRYLHLTGELGIVLQNSPYITLSKSAKYRVGVAFQYALAKLTGARILLIDEADILDDDRRGDLIKFLLAKVADFDQIMVFMTCTEPPQFAVGDGKLQVWWLENGSLTQVVNGQEVQPDKTA